MKSHISVSLRTFLIRHTIKSIVKVNWNANVLLITLVEGDSGKDNVFCSPRQNKSPLRIDLVSLMTPVIVLRRTG